MSENASERTEPECTCECHHEGKCPRVVPAQVSEGFVHALVHDISFQTQHLNLMSVELLTAKYLQFEAGHGGTGRLPPQSLPIVDDLDSLFPLLSDRGLFEWGKYVFGNWESWDMEQAGRLRVLESYLDEIDRRFDIPPDKSEVRRILQLRDGPGCVCRRDPPACDFGTESGFLLENYQVAHVFPKSKIAKEKKDEWSNLALMRPACNNSQGPKHFHSWIKEQTGIAWWYDYHWKIPKSDKPEDLIACVGIRWRH